MTSLRFVRRRMCVRAYPRAHCGGSPRGGRHGKGLPAGRDPVSMPPGSLGGPGRLGFVNEAVFKVGFAPCRSAPEATSSRSPEARDLVAPSRPRRTTLPPQGEARPLPRPPAIPATTRRVPRSAPTSSRSRSPSRRRHPPLRLRRQPGSGCASSRFPKPPATESTSPSQWPSRSSSTSPSPERARPLRLRLPLAPPACS